MKILYFACHLNTPGGIDRIVIEKANLLSEIHDVVLLTTNQKNKDFFYGIDKKVKHVDYSDYGNKKSVFFTKNLFNEIINKEKPDIIIAVTGKESLVLPFFDKKIKKIKEMHFSKFHRRIQNENSNFLKKLIVVLMDWIEEKVFSMYDTVVPLTYEDKRNWNLKNTKVIYNFKSFESNEKAKLENKIAISVGRLDYQKGFDILLDTWAKVCEKNKDWSLIICGDGLLKEDLLKQSKLLGIEDRVIFKGNVKDIKEEYLKSSLYIMTSRHEGLPLVLLEAMECGLPIISFDCPCGPKEIIKNNVGIIVKDFDQNEMAKEILSKIEKTKELKEMGEKAKQEAQLYTKEKIIEKWGKLFKELSINDK